MSKNNHKSQAELTVEVPVVEAIAPVELTPVSDFSVSTQLYGGLSPVMASHIATIEEYTRAMAPGTPIQPTQGAAYQDRLYRSILGILSAESIQDTINGLDRVMALFRVHSQGALHLTYTQRFIDEWHTDERTRDTFTHLCLALSTYSDPDRRARYGNKMMITGDRNIFQHLPAEMHNRLVQYLTRYVYDADDEPRLSY